MCKRRWPMLLGGLLLSAGTLWGTTPVLTHPPGDGARFSSDLVRAATAVRGAPARTSRWGRGGFVLMPGVALGSTAAAEAASAAAVTRNWSGYAATGGRFTSVSAAWTQPAVTCTAQDTFSGFWAGLDGVGTPSAEQTGTQAECNGGTPAYSGWFEMFPAAKVVYDNPVRPGDAMSASVTTSGTGTFTLTLTDQTQGWNQVTRQTSATAQLGSAEVIAEAPSSTTALPLADFGTVNFTAATVNGAPPGNALRSLTMVSADGVTEATPSPLRGGNAFSVTWHSSGA